LLARFAEDGKLLLHDLGDGTPFNFASLFLEEPQNIVLLVSPSFPPTHAQIINFIMH
jgi:mannose/fructose-specific phosphotransferase system component IIA